MAGSFPYNVRVNVNVPFPTRVFGSGPITVSKNNGVWAIGYSLLGIPISVPPASAYPTDYLLVYDSIAKTSIRISLSALSAALTSSPVLSFDEAVGDYNVTNETNLLIDKTIPAAHSINLPDASLRDGAELVVKDIAGNAETYVATIMPFGGAKIDGLAALPINQNYGGVRLVPLPDGDWYLAP